ncbi:MAG: type I pantothenate kinase [Propionibacteriaceae bacterium]|nr:type I pantothenate kinase [Propionibacteriaceae bacterium]
MADNNDGTSSAFLTLPRDHWAKLSSDRNLGMSNQTMGSLLAMGDPLDPDHLRQVYLPLAELINVYIENTTALSAQSNAYLGLAEKPTPFIIGIAGSVAVGKSTTARLLRELLSINRRVDLVTTDGFLYPNAVLEKKGIMDKKGFPKSYDRTALLKFVMDVKSGVEANSGVYSHITYDIVPGEVITINQPDVLIIEGLNVLQPTRRQPDGTLGMAVSDFFDFSVYVDAPEPIIKQWFLDRFRQLRTTAFTEPDSFFRQFAHIPDDEAIRMASDIWDTTNGPNLLRNIQPTRDRATVVISKGDNHEIDWVRIRKI